MSYSNWAELSVSNPKIRRAELMTRIAGFDLVAQSLEDFPISLAKQWNDKPNRDWEPKGDEIIGLTWERVVFPTRIHQWTVQHKCEPNKLKRPVELKGLPSESAAIIPLHQVGSEPLEYCQ